MTVCTFTFMPFIDLDLDLKTKNIFCFSDFSYASGPTYSFLTNLQNKLNFHILATKT